MVLRSRFIGALRFLWTFTCAPDQQLEQWYSVDAIQATAFCCLVIFLETGFLFFPFLPGDLLLILVGSLLSRLALPVWPTVLAFACAASIGGVVNYLVGRYLGGAALWAKLENLEWFRTRFRKGRGSFHRYGESAVMVARFVPWARSFIPFLAGASRMSIRRYLAYNGLGALVWVLTVLSMGTLVPSMSHWIGMAVTFGLFSPPIFGMGLYGFRWLRQNLFNESKGGDLLVMGPSESALNAYKPMDGSPACEAGSVKSPNP